MDPVYLAKLLPPPDAPEAELRAGVLAATLYTATFIPLPYDAEFDAPAAGKGLAAGGGGAASAPGRTADLHTIYNLSELVSRMTSPDLTDPSFMMAIASAKNTGKTRFVRELIGRLRTIGLIQYVTVISAIPESSMRDYGNPIGHGGELVDKFYEYQPLIAQRVYDAQRQIFDSGTETPRHLVVFDDVAGTTINHDSGLTSIATRGRQFNLSSIVSSQLPNTVLTPTFKSMADYTLFGMLDTDGQKIISKGLNYQPLMSPKEFSEWLRKNVGGAIGSPNRFVFGLYDKLNQQLLKIRAE